MEEFEKSCTMLGFSQILFRSEKCILTKGDIMNLLLQPKVVCFGYRVDEAEMVFLGRDGEVCLQFTEENSEHLVTIETILRCCNGYLNLAQIREKVHHIQMKFLLINRSIGFP